jgi:hypothetical protein
MKTVLQEIMLTKIFSTLLGRAPIPASDSDRLVLAKLVMNYRLERDTACRNYFQELDLTPDDFTLEELLNFQDGLLIKLTEQHLAHMDHFYSTKHRMDKQEFEASHVMLLNTAHHQMALQAGYDIPLDHSIRSIQDYIAHFFDHMPEEIQHPFPHHLIPPCVELVKRFYRR